MGPAEQALEDLLRSMVVKSDVMNDVDLHALHLDNVSTVLNACKFVDAESKMLRGIIKSVVEERLKTPQ